jgi:hypothetical protein
LHLASIKVLAHVPYSYQGENEKQKKQNIEVLVVKLRGNVISATWITSSYRKIMWGWIKNDCMGMGGVMNS